MNNIILVIITGISSFTGAWIGSRRRFVIKPDEKGEEIVVESQPLINRDSTASFIADPTQEELDEMNQPAKWKKFIKGFVKPGK